MLRNFSKNCKDINSSRNKGGSRSYEYLTMVWDTDILALWSCGLAHRALNSDNRLRVKLNINNLLRVI